MSIEKITVGNLKTNCYLVRIKDRVLVIDPGAEANKIIGLLESRNLEPNYFLATHGHFDHVSAVGKLKNKYCRSLFLISENDLRILKNSGLLAPLFGYPPLLTPAKPDGFLENLILPDLKIIKTPGHSPGSVGLFFNPARQSPIFFSGDTLFANCVGRYDFWLGSKEELKKSLKKLLALPPETKVYPGHGEPFRLAKAGEFLPKLLAAW